MKKLLFFCLMGLVSYAHTQNNQWQVYKENNSGLSSNSIKSITFDKNNAWISTINGLTIKSDSGWEVFNSSNSVMTDNYVRTVGIDHLGTKWMGTTNGLIAVSGSSTQKAWTLFNSANSGLPVNNISAVAFDSQYRNWFGTWGGGLALLQGVEWKTYNKYNSGLPANGIYDVKVDHNDNVWIATHGGGLAVFDGAHWMVYNTSSSNIPSNIIYSIEFDWMSNIWLGTDIGLVMFNGFNQWKLFNLSNTGFDFAEVLSVKVDNLNRLIYFGTNNGLGIIDAGDFSFKRTNNSGLSYNRISSINIDEDSNVWIGTLGGGISIYNENGVTLSSENIYNAPEATFVSLYPNPLKNTATFYLDLPISSDVSITIYNMTGNVVNTSNLFNVHGNEIVNIDVSSLSQGMYYYDVNTNGFRHSSKFIKL